MDGCIRRDIIQQSIKGRLLDALRLAAYGCQPVSLELALNLPQVRGRRRIAGPLDDGEARQREAASGEAGGSAFHILPDRISDRAAQELCGAQYELPTRAFRTT